MQNSCIHFIQECSMKKTLLKTLCLPAMLMFCKAEAQPLNDVIISSEVKISQKDLNTLLNPFIGKEISVPMLQGILNELTAFYQKKGFLAVQAFYPEQQSQNGVVKVVVKTVHLNEIKINNLSTVNNSTVYSLLSRTRRLQNQNINTDDLNTELLRVKDLNVVDIAGYFENADDQDDAANLSLDIKSKRRFSFMGFYDNYGNKSTGKNRFVGAISTTDLTHHADSASFLAATTDEKQNSFNFDYRIPFNSRLDILGTSLSYSNYELADRYDDLDARGGIFESSIYLEDPLYRSMNTRIALGIGGFYKNIHDEIRAYDLKMKRHSMGGFSKLSIDNSFGSLRLNHALKFNYGKVKNDDEYKLYDDGSFKFATLDGNLVFDINNYLSFSNQFNLQVAFSKLDSSEKFMPCGAYGVKAFESNLASSDHGLFDDLKVTAKISSSPNISVYTDFMQAHSKNYDSSKKESFYAMGLGGEITYHGFFINTSVNKAIGKNKSYAKDDIKFLVKLGYYQD